MTTTTQEITMAATALQNGVETFREAKAQRIRELAQRWVENTIQLGKELIEVRDTFPVLQPTNPNSARPGWTEWLHQHTGFSPGHARSFVRIAEKFDVGVADIGVSHQVLEFLARDHVPEPGRQEVIERIQSGERIGRGRATAIVNEHRPPPSEANKIARETGRLVTASDGNIYSGATEEESADHVNRRQRTYGIRDAIDAICDCGVTPAQWVNEAEDHWLHDFRLGSIDEAIAWLTTLKADLAEKQGVFDAE